MKRQTAKAKTKLRARSLSRPAPGASSIDDAEIREFIADLHAAATSMRRLRSALASVAGLKAAEYAVVLGVWYCERAGRTSVRDIADHLKVAPAHVTDEIGKLGRAGFIVKRASAKDRRAVEVRLTQKSWKLFNELAMVFRDVNHLLFENINRSDMLIVREFFKRIIEWCPDAIRLAESHTARTSRTSSR